MAGNFNWDEYEAVEPQADNAGFDWNSYETVAPAKQKISELDSSARGAAQGLSFGLRDEAAGALQNPLGGLKEIANKFGADFSDEDVDSYKKERDESRRLDLEAKEANPISFGTGQVGGAIVPTLLTGGAGGIGALAAQGAVQGLGTSEAEDLGGLAEDAAIGGSIGAASGVAGKLLSNTGTGIANATQDVVERVATNPTLSKVANLQPAQKIKSFIQEPIKKVLGDEIGDFVGKQAGRIAAYKTPGVNIAQGVSDAASLVQKGAQKVADLDLTTIIPKLGKFAPVLQNAASRGSQSVAATHYILQSSNPEYQEAYAEATKGQ